MARQGIVTPEMEFIALRENGAQASGLWGQQASGLRSEPNRRDARSPHRQDAYAPNDLHQQHAGESFARRFQNKSRPNLCGLRSLAAAPSSSQHQSPRKRADDHWPQFPGEDQRQHRQQRRGVSRLRKKLKRCAGRQSGGADTVMDLSTGKNIHATREWIIRTPRCRSAPCRFISASKRSAAALKN